MNGDFEELQRQWWLWPENAHWHPHDSVSPVCCLRGCGIGGEVAQAQWRKSAEITSVPTLLSTLIFCAVPSPCCSVCLPARKPSRKW